MHFLDNVPGNEHILPIKVLMPIRESGRGGGLANALFG